MSADATMSQKVATREAHDTATRLSGRALLLARALWFFAVAGALGLYALSVPLQVQVLQTTCSNDCHYGQLTVAQMQELQQLGLSANFYVAYNVALTTIFFLVFVMVGALIFWRKSNDGFGIYVALALVLFGSTFGDPLSLIVKLYPGFGFPLLILAGVGGTLIGIFMYLFPDGRFVPRWTRWLIPFVAAREFASGFGLDAPLLTAAFLIELGSFVFAQIYRYRRASSAVARQQTKWFVYGITVAVLGFASLILVFNLTSPNGEPGSVVVSLIASSALYLFVMLIPLSIMMAILRYRLWDIDILINRTLVYVPLTAILAGVFSASITLTQRFFVALTGQTSDAATVLTTLLVVAAFEPIKSGLQHLVDLRFKEARDPTRQLTAYNDQVRAFVEMMDPEQNTRRLLDETVRAFEAKGGAVFLQRNSHLELVHTAGQWNDDSEITVPLESNGARVGALALGPRRNGAQYTAQDRATLQSSSQLVARAIALAERTNGAGK